VQNLPLPLAELQRYLIGQERVFRSQTVDLDYAEGFFNASPANPSTPTPSSRRLDGSATAVDPCTVTEPVVVVSLRTTSVRRTLRRNAL
jgi:hypothetical protein